MEPAKPLFDDTPPMDNVPLTWGIGTFWVAVVTLLISDSNWNTGGDVFISVLCGLSVGWMCHAHRRGKAIRKAAEQAQLERDQHSKQIAERNRLDGIERERKQRAAMAEMIRVQKAQQERAEAEWERCGFAPGNKTPEFLHGQGGGQWVYVFSFNTHLELAKLKNEAPIVKIGMTTNHYSARIKEQTRGQSAIHERAITIMAIRCTNAAALESHLHTHFTRKGRRHAAGGGREWFKVTPAEIMQAAGDLTRL